MNKIAVPRGEAAQARAWFNALSAYEQDALSEFLKTLQVLPPGTRALIVDEDHGPHP